MTYLKISIILIIIGNNKRKTITIHTSIHTLIHLLIHTILSNSIYNNIYNT